jgi:HAE1 family hydrophobic/amphiphilic exporter-1
MKACSYVQLVKQEKRTRTTDQVINDLRYQLADIPSADLVLTPASHFGGGGESDLQIELTGDDMNKLVDLSDQMMEVVGETKGTVDVGRSWKTGKPEMAVGPLRDRIAARGSSAQEIAMTMRFGLEGQVASKYREGEDEYDIRVQLAPEDRARVDQLESYQIKTGNGWIPLPELSSIKQVSGPTQILRKNKQRMVIVTANLAGRTLGDVRNDIQASSERLFWPEGYRLNFGGQAEFMAREFPYLFQAMILAIILTYMLMAAMLESLVQPFTILFTLPLGLIGAAILMVLTGKSISMFSLMAFVMLVGIVVNNAILLIDYTNVKRSEGLALTDAILAACPVRLRPIIMTNIANIIGMLPLALGIGVGGGFRAPMAIVSIGAFMSSTIFTLYLIPVLYSIFESTKSEGGFFRWMLGAWKRL